MSWNTDEVESEVQKILYRNSGNLHPLLQEISPVKSSSSIVSKYELFHYNV